MFDSRTLLRTASRVVLMSAVSILSSAQAENTGRFGGLPSAASPSWSGGDARGTTAVTPLPLSSSEGGIEVSGRLGSAFTGVPLRDGREALTSNTNTVYANDGGIAVSGVLDAGSAGVPLGEFRARSLLEQQMDLSIQGSN